MLLFQLFVCESWTYCKLSVRRHIPGKPSEEIQNFVNDTAYRLVRAQEENMVLKPWVLLASLLLQNHHQNQTAGQERGIALDELTAQAVWLRDVSREYGAFLNWPGTVRVQDSSLSVLLVHYVLTNNTVCLLQGS